MIAIRLKILFLIACFVEAIFLLVAQVLGSTVLLIPCLICFLVLVAWSALKRMSVPVFMFFLPFATLLKMRPGTISFYTVALFAAYVIYTVMGSRNLKVYHIIPALCLIALTLAVRTFYGYSLENSYLLFCATLLLLPFLAQELDGEYDFYWLTCFFALGIIVAAVTARQLTAFPTISRYIEVFDLFGARRYSGYYGDPNFYSAQITAAIGGVLVLLLNRMRAGQTVMLVLLMAMLLYAGFMSVSKSFLLVTVVLLLLWGVSILFQKERLSAKLMVLLTFGFGVLFLLSSTLFTDMIDTVIGRFSGNDSLSDLTTGRTELWMSYLKAFIEDPALLLFGNGYVHVLVNERASHNTIIQTVFQFGLVGGLVLLAWVACYVRMLLDDTRIRWDTLAQLCILCIGAFGPWMALDLLFFDDFFLVPVYVCVAIRFVTRRAMETEEIETA